MKPFCLLVVSVLVTLSSAVSSVAQSSNGCFRAAILDQVPQQDQTHQKSIDANLELYERSARLAKQNDADIVVCPEMGIFTDGGRAASLKYGEQMPDQKTQVCSDSFVATHPVLHRLGCIAKANHIYLVVDVLDVQPCLTNCSSDNKLVFNTAVLIDRDGNFRAKYHKYHLFGELDKNMPAKPDLVVVDTEIGRLGLQICFDLVYEKPGHLMATRGMIDTMIFPTLWFDQTPFLTAAQFQVAWTFTHSVNLLGANIHHTAIGAKGSGIIAGSRKQFELVDHVDGTTRLLIASLPISTSSDAHCPLNATTLEVAQAHPIIDLKKPVTYFHKSLDLTNVQLTHLQSHSSNATNCHQGVCCSVDYQMDESTLLTEDEFYLIVSNRTRPGAFPWAEEFCGVIHCPKKEKTCSEVQSDLPLHSKFHFIELSGQFGSSTILYSSVIGSQHKVMQMENLWSFGNSTKGQFSVLVGKRGSAESHSIGTVALYGRVYERDPPFVQRAPILH